MSAPESIWLQRAGDMSGGSYMRACGGGGRWIAVTRVKEGRRWKSDPMHAGGLGGQSVRDHWGKVGGLSEDLIRCRHWNGWWHGSGEMRRRDHRGRELDCGLGL